MRLLPLAFLFSFGLLSFEIAGCEIDTAPEGLRRTPPGSGPLVKFDAAHRPLPEIPLPNDVATFADPTSRTGRRVNVSAIAPTRMEERARRDFALMEGWGVSSPISVAFDRAPGADAREPAIDIDAVADRMEGDEHDPSNDPFYIVNLTTGIPALVDVGSGYYPVVMRDPHRYGPNDPKASESNLVFETVEEGAGLPQSAYRPELDRDFDGVLDHPNVLPRRRSAPGAIAGVDDLITWYERETDTLILRPIVPLEEKTEYAVVLTDRLRGPDGQPVRSPFGAIHHPAQEGAVTRLKEWLTDRRLANYYGDIAGTGLDHVAFAWSFTTQPTHEDMRLLRDGLYGKGPFARWKDEFPSEVTTARVAGIAPASEGQPPGWENTSAACGQRAKTPYVLKLNEDDLRGSFRLIFEQVFGLQKGGLKAVEDSLQYIDHIVLGSFVSPFLMGNPASRDPDSRFDVSFVTGQGEVQTDNVQWVLVVPKAKGALKQPFPVAFYGHGVTGHADEVLLYGGDFARQGIALIGYNNPGHGLVLGAGDQRIASALLGSNCVVPFLDGILGGRAHDITGDGLPDSGWLWWTAHIFHTRDNVRQGILDGMNLVRILRSFDGRIGPQDLTGDGKPDIAGDFDGDGVPDVGGPNVPYFAAGESLGGIMSDIQGGIEPHMIASAPMSGGGGLAMDVALRSYGVVESVAAQFLGPAVFALPASERPARPGNERIEAVGSRCAPSQRTVRLLVNEGVRNQELELACLDPVELAAGMTVVVTNVSSGEVRCARTELDGRFHVPIPTSTGDRLDVQIYTAPDVVGSYDGCVVKRGAPVGRRIQTFEQAAVTTFPVSDSDRDKCGAEEGCQQFRERFFSVGSPLVAPNEGLGIRRQSPEMRRFRDLAQAALDPGDPIVYAPYYMLKPLYDENGQRVPPHALLAESTVGDNFVQVSAHLAFARAAGALPFLPPNAVDRFPAWADYATPADLYEKLGRRTPMKFLVDNGVAEGIARLGRTSAGPACKANYATQDPALCDRPTAIDPYDCKIALYDADWVSEGRLPYDQPHPDVPLRLARVAKIRAVDSTSLAASWEPRLRGVPFGPDESGWTATERVVGVLNHYIVPEGQHTWSTGDACRAWDFATYGNALTARFFASRGQDIYYLSHPKTHGCLVDGTCELFR
jgi:hypothetical protein